MGKIPPKGVSLSDFYCYLCRIIRISILRQYSYDRPDYRLQQDFRRAEKL